MVRSRYEGSAAVEFRCGPQRVRSIPAARLGVQGAWRDAEYRRSSLAGVKHQRLSNSSGVLLAVAQRE